ncbi:hypothetical protein OAU50_05870 [Planctomycetota bacterium]|nr:hypothetical protein [Planctomycetota bacterium]
MFENLIVVSAVAIASAFILWRSARFLCAPTGKKACGACNNCPATPAKEH